MCRFGMGISHIVLFHTFVAHTIVRSSLMSVLREGVQRLLLPLYIAFGKLPPATATPARLRRGARGRVWVRV